MQNPAHRHSQRIQKVEIEVKPAARGRWPDVLALFEEDGERGCWCQYFRVSSSRYHSRPHGQGEVDLRRQVEKGPPPGLVAYVDGEPAGWLGFGLRASLERLVRSRTIPNIDSTPVWSIVCFKVKVGFRRKGVAHALLNGAVEFAKKEGIPALEAYPIDPADRRIDVASAYVGFTRMFKKAGFKRVSETRARSASRPRILMRLDLEQPDRSKGN